MRCFQKIILEFILIPSFFSVMVSQASALSVRYLSWKEMTSQSAWVVYASIANKITHQGETASDYEEIALSIIECFKPSSCPSSLSFIQGMGIPGTPRFPAPGTKGYFFINPRHNIVGVFQGGPFIEMNETIINHQSPDAFVIKEDRLVLNKDFKGIYRRDEFRTHLTNLLGNPVPPDSVMFQQTEAGLFDRLQQWGRTVLQQIRE